MDNQGQLQDQVVEVRVGEEGPWERLGGVPERRGSRWSRESWAGMTVILPPDTGSRWRWRVLA